MSGSFYLYLLVAAAVTYLIRVLPLTLFRKPIRSRFVRSFLYYVPYVTLSVMTFPAILSATDHLYAGIAAFAVGVIVAWLDGNLFRVALSCCMAVFLTEWLFPLLFPALA